MYNSRKHLAPKQITRIGLRDHCGERGEGNAVEKFKVLRREGQKGLRPTVLRHHEKRDQTFERKGVGLYFGEEKQTGKR